MPELPEVETVLRGLEPVMLGCLIQDVRVRRRDLRVAISDDFEKNISGKRIVQLIRRGKYIIALNDQGAGFCLHLGMSGRIKIFTDKKSYEDVLHDHVLFRMENGDQIVFHDPRRFGMLYLVDANWEKEKPFSVMGEEPLSETFSGLALWHKLESKKVPIKNALLDQNVVAGVGNIYACEALYQAEIHPTRLASSIRKREAELLVKSIRNVLTNAIDAGGSTLRDHRKTDGSMGYFQYGFSVYDREGKPCPSCDCDLKKTGGIQRIVQSGRSSFFCPVKQT